MASLKPKVISRLNFNIQWDNKMRRFVSAPVLALAGFLLMGLCSGAMAFADDASEKTNGNGKVEKADKTEDSIKKNQYQRFQKGAVDLGIQGGWGYAVDIPPGDRTNWRFAFVAPSLKYNLTGIIGKSFYRGSLFWVNEVEAIVSHHPETRYIFGYSPVMLEYKFLWPKVDWSPYVFGGGGFSHTDWNEARQREIATNFEFLLHLGGGVEFYKTKQGAFSVNYRFFHVSNAGIQFPNIGINTNLFTIGYSF
jgi:hypothetical protein